ncbi:MAG: 2-amino-4-hydroxy-6-hydroxymethyldihydropteridine diphosphokinase [Planctomycetota bacterium]
MSETVTAAIALGANLPGPAGTPADSVREAIGLLDGVEGVRVTDRSSLHITEPVGPPGQPDYVNACVLIHTGLGPRALLYAMLQIERGLGRDRLVEERWGPRTVDLDLLTHGSHTLDSEGLTLPHPRMHERRFVLAPLAEIAPDLIVPRLERSVGDLLALLDA